MTAPAGTEQGQNENAPAGQGPAAAADATADQLAEAAVAAKALADQGQQAIDRMKVERNAAKAELAQFKSLGLDPAKLKELIGKSETDALASEQARVQREAEQAALGKANERLVRAEIKAAATGKLANPALAAQLLAATGVDVSSFDVDDDGNVDQAAITQALDELIQKEPYLGVTQGDATRFNGTADGGPRGTAGKPQMTLADVKRLHASGDTDAIEAARVDGRLNTILGIT